MELRNKKTGEIGKLSIGCKSLSKRNLCVISNRVYEYVTLASLFDEWEDYEEPLEPYWYINDLDGEPMKCDLKNCGKSNFVKWSEHRKKIGNHFKTEEEAERASEKLKAITRLKDKGMKLRFDSGTNCIAYKFDQRTLEEAELVEVIKDLGLLFGGEE